MNEKQVEKRLLEKVKSVGGLAWKFVSPGMRGVPDRILLFPGGRIVFVECKAPGEKPRKQQIHRMNQLRKLGFPCYIADSYESIDKIIEEVMTNELYST